MQECERRGVSAPLHARTRQPFEDWRRLSAADGFERANECLRRMRRDGPSLQRDNQRTFRRHGIARQPLGGAHANVEVGVTHQVGQRRYESSSIGQLRRAAL
jgi:hypothetical protein